ncbi:MAG: substrate-binding domain-containing protein, partial [Alphaproteobacteria bacterium]
WKMAGIDAAAATGGWYRETGSGMGATLNAAAAMNGYALADRGTWLAFANKSDLKILLEGDPRILNPYGIILVNPARHPHVKAASGQAFIDWLTSAAGQAAINGFRVNGEKLFVGNAR